MSFKYIYKGVEGAFDLEEKTMTKFAIKMEIYVRFQSTYSVKFLDNLGITSQNKIGVKRVLKIFDDAESADEFLRNFYLCDVPSFYFHTDSRNLFYNEPLGAQSSSGDYSSRSIGVDDFLLIFSIEPVKYPISIIQQETDSKISSLQERIDYLEGKLDALQGYLELKEEIQK